jgi:RNA polymerase sigma-70 factor (ECF subfamily)
MTDIKKQFIEHIPRLRRYARVLLKNNADADDLVQDCLERACGRVNASLPIINLRAWLFTIMHNLFANSIRAKTRRPEMTEYDDDFMASESATPEHSLMVRDITGAMEILAVEQREVLLLVAVENMRYEDIAELLNVPIGTVMSRLSRARKHLKSILENGKVITLKRVK